MVNRNFRLFSLGHIVSAIGDQITLTAFPWLILQFTGDPAQVGLVLAIVGGPRALLMIVGGAMIDRYSPRLVMLVSGAGRMAGVLALAAVLYQDQTNIAVIYVLALFFGLMDAFYYPAATAIVPTLVAEKDLQKANSINSMIHQAALIFGPIIAAVAIGGSLGSTLTGADQLVTRFEDYRPGLARAFALDSMTFLFSIVTLTMLTLEKREAPESQSVIEDVKTALRFVWQIPAMRLAFIGFGCLEFFFQSPVFIGLPALSALRYEDGAAAFAQMVAAYGVGGLIGGGVAGWTKPLSPTRVVPLMFLMFGWSSAVFGMVIYYDPLWWAIVAFLTAGLTDGYIYTHFITWVQHHTPGALIGRVMATLMVMAVGLLPLAHIAIGYLLSIDIEGVLYAVSVIMVLICGAAAAHKDARNLGAANSQ